MATALERLKVARDAFCNTLANEALREEALTNAGHPVLVTYSENGVSVQWTGSWAALVDRVKKLEELIAMLDTGESSIIGYSGY